jgi:imidazole glycerol-phosphate synthase subunit HisH
MTTALVDYGAGNLTSVIKALVASGTGVDVVSSPDRLSGASAIVIPGVGHFGRTASLDEPWRRAIRSRIAAETPVLGICLGLHWLFDGSDEAPGIAGLGIFHGRCARLQGDVKVPHVGWNALELTGRTSRLLDGIARGAFAYFSHSYAAAVADDAVATTTHGHSFVSVVERGGVFGTQFHPEKSDATGLRVLANFVSISAAGKPC